jgi:hypothetical protein
VIGAEVIYAFDRDVVIPGTLRVTNRLSGRIAFQEKERTFCPQLMELPVFCWLIQVTGIAQYQCGRRPRNTRISKDVVHFGGWIISWD